MIERNIKLLRKIRKVLTDKPDKHKQATWMTVASKEVRDKLNDSQAEGKPGIKVSCTTTACVAGLGCLLSGDMAWINRFDEPQRGVYLIDYVIDKDGDKHMIQTRARNLMGLTQREAVHLFKAGRPKASLIRDLETLIAGGSIG